MSDCEAGRSISGGIIHWEMGNSLGEDLPQPNGPLSELQGSRQEGLEKAIFHLALAKFSASQAQLQISPSDLVFTIGRTPPVLAHTWIRRAKAARS